jgi:polysaccharide export outer membrane protein
VTQSRTILTAFAALALLTACSLPRGAAIQSEIINEQDAEVPSFQVVKVTRDVTPDLKHWPATGWHGHYHWFGRDHVSDASVIRPGDSMLLSVWESEENSLLTGAGQKVVQLPESRVSASGQIFMPYLGDVAVSGLTIDQARARLQKRLTEISPSAQVQLEITEGLRNSVDLVSGVAAPGSYPLENRNISIMSILAQGGGVNGSLRNPLIRLHRGSRTFETRVDDLLADSRRNVRVRGGDQIAVVEDERSFNVLGAAGNQQVMYFEQETMSAMEALSAMGGLEASRANPKGVLVLREYDPEDLKPGMSGPDLQQVVFTIDLTGADGLFAARQFEINPGDTVLATESPVNAARTIFGLLGTVVGFSNTANNL